MLSILFSTIGFGDIVPGKSLAQEGSQEKLLICSLYLLFGMALIAMCFKLMQDDVVQKARWLGRKIGLLVKEDDSESESEVDEVNAQNSLHALVKSVSDEMPKPGKGAD